MGTRQVLLKLLQDHPGVYLSGEELARQLGVSRTAVWKAIRALKDKGYGIEAVTNRGYCLSADTDVLDPEAIRGLLTGFSWELHPVSSLASTNSALRELAGQGAPEGTVLIAASQSAGRGRMGRQFYSPEGTGLYMSLLLRPRELSPAESLQLTTMAAAALCMAIQQVTGLEPQIKWVNDLFLNGKKICGILTEGSFNLETGLLQDAVLGLGLNLYPPREGFPPELKNIAGALLPKNRPDLKNTLTAAFLNQFSEFYREKKFRKAAEIYRSRSLLTGRQVEIQGKTAEVLDINDRCQLVVRYDDGSIQALSYGEVTIVNCL